ncbi:MAG: leucine-rich repeat protein [Butyrivibrio sp.]|nr:leucine-rich repeat protein [Butyrivibrio sp.]
MKKRGLIFALIAGLFLNNAFVSLATEQNINDSDAYPADDLSLVEDRIADEEVVEVSPEAFKNIGRRSSSRNSLNALNSSASDKYNSYYYNKLSAMDKKAYDAYLKAERANKGCVDTLTENNRDSYGVIYYEGTEAKPDIDWISVLNAIQFDHPEELESIVYTTGINVVSSVVDGITQYKRYVYFKPGENYSGSEIASLEASLSAACDSFYKSLNLTGDDYNKELIIHDALINAMEYNHPVADGNKRFDVAHTAYGAFVDKSPVCDGYAKAFKMLLNKAGIEAHVVAGDSTGGGHAWNIVKIAGNFYEVDVTWDDRTIGDSYLYKNIYLHDYFNRTTDDFLSHTIDIPGFDKKTTYHRRSDYMGYLKPDVATATAKSYRRVNKVYHVTFDKVKDDAYYYLPYGSVLTYEGRLLEMPQEVTLNGSTFDNWYTAKEGGSVVNKNTVFSGDTTVYARWIGGSTDDGDTGNSGEGGTFIPGEDNSSEENTGESGSSNSGESSSNPGDNNSGESGSSNSGESSSDPGDKNLSEGTTTPEDKDTGKESSASEENNSAAGSTATQENKTENTVAKNDAENKITEIYPNAYKNNKKLKKITISSDIEKIGSCAFKGCKNLKKITIKADNLKSVGKYSFKGINKKAKITIICKNKKKYNKVVRLIKKAGAKTATYKFKKG